VRIPADAGLSPKQMALLDVGGDTGTVRVVWMRPDGVDAAICGVQFLDPRPAFLPTLYRWLGRESAMGPYDPR
jgi:hypothetical protein